MIESNVILYPNIENVFKDKSLGLFFRPLLTANVLVDGNPYSIHLLGTDGLYCQEKRFEYAEQYFFSFKYDNGLYEFLGDLRVFQDHDKVQSVYDFLLMDFLQNRDSYLSNKTRVREYIKNIEAQLKEVSTFQDFSNAEYYSKAFYSYEFTKYHYEKYGVHKHISVITDNFEKNTDAFLLHNDDAMWILEDFFSDLENNVRFEYEINDKMFVAGTQRTRFMSLSGGGSVLAMLDPTKEIVYILEFST